MEILIPISVAVISALASYIASNYRIGKEIELAETRLRRDYQLEFSTKSVIHQLLSIKKWKLRSFEEIKKRLEGLDDIEIKKALIRAGAVCFRNHKNKEMWGLVKRNRDKLEIE